MAVTSVTVVTTTFVRTVSELRARLAVQTCKNTHELELPLIVVDGGSPAEFTEELAHHGARVYLQESLGFGPAFRQSLRLAPRGSAVFRTGPEKHTLVPKIPLIMKPILEGRAHMVNPTRQSMISHPPEQQCSERMVNLAFQYASGRDIDVCFGPFGLSPEAFPYFLDYAGEYGDIWDALHVPRFRIVKSRLTVYNIPVDYYHPREQTAEEQGKEVFFMKRVEQIQKLAQAFWEESRKLAG